jgi:hypothetical protein
LPCSQDYTILAYNNIQHNAQKQVSTSTVAVIWDMRYAKWNFNTISDGPKDPSAFPLKTALVTHLITIHEPPYRCKWKLLYAPSKYRLYYTCQFQYQYFVSAKSNTLQLLRVQTEVRHVGGFIYMSIDRHVSCTLYGNYPGQLSMQPQEVYPTNLSHPLLYVSEYFFLFRNSIMKQDCKQHNNMS